MELEEEIVLEDDIDIIDILDFGFPRHLHVRPNYIEDMDDLGFFRRFRLMKPTVMFILDLVEDQLEFDNDLNNSGEDGEIYRNRKSYFSINVQLVCDSDLRINNIVARWPGSTHDATIFNNSRLRARFEGGEFGGGILLGDSGYPLKSYLLTPFANPATHAQQLYNESHIRTRNCIERANGVLKKKISSPVLWT
ncbi:hypothetical protein NQ318_001687 [Aromia moschata]|uniref:DDE Tnp4 domain-containing protein n=1 Tax=Aromia moschata TaxID=1265417 RepID=A0AAV8X4G8_9CUCU|nr:hypothetical protein NQ318_001687 [Aromia moschata]